MASPEPARRLGPLKLFTKAKVTNWPATDMRRALLGAAISLLVVAGAFWRREDIANWYVGVIVGGIMTIGCGVWAVYSFKKARWYHHVETTLDPDDKRGS